MDPYLSPVAKMQVSAALSSQSLTDEVLFVLFLAAERRS